MRSDDEESQHNNRGELPLFKDQVADRNSQRSDNNRSKLDAATQKTPGAVHFGGSSGTNPSLPVYKDQVGVTVEVNREVVSSPATHAGLVGAVHCNEPASSHHPPGGGEPPFPCYKDQVGGRETVGPTMHQSAQDDPFPASMNQEEVTSHTEENHRPGQVSESSNHPSNTPEPEQDHNKETNNSTHDDDSFAYNNEHSNRRSTKDRNLVEAELVKEIQEAQVVVAEKRVVKRKVCAVWVLLNALLVAVLVFGGTCIFDGDCVLVGGKTSAEQLLQNNVSCVAELAIACETSQGVRCSDVEPPNIVACADADNVTAIEFELANVLCPGSGDEATDCTDSNVLLISQPTQIRCTSLDDGLALRVHPSVVVTGDKFVVSSMEDGRDLPEAMGCFLIQNGNVLQSVKINTTEDSWFNPFVLGALQVRGCATTVCRSTFSYSVTIENANQDPLTLSSLEFFPPNGVPFYMFESSRSTILTEGESRTTTHVVEVDICFGFEYIAWAFLEASLGNGATCQGSAEFPGATESPTLSPVYASDDSTDNSTGENDDCAILINAQCRTETDLDCADVTDLAELCSGSLVYNITVSNVGESPFNLDRLNVEFGRERLDLSESDQIVRSLLTEQSMSIQQEIEFNECLEGSSTEVSISAGGFSPTGYSCSSQIEFDSAMLGPRNCAVYSGATCTLSDGRPCSDISFRRGSCSHQDFLDLQFRYRDASCGGPGLMGECTDFARLPREVEIQCFDERGSRLVILPSDQLGLYYNDQFTVSAPLGGRLNGTVDCTFLGANGMLLQRNVMDVTTFEEVKEGARSGGLELISCRDASCQKPISFQVTLENNGAQALSIYRWAIEPANDSTNGQLPSSLFPYLKQNPLSAGASTSLEINLMQDFCFGSSLPIFSLGVSGRINGTLCHNFDPEATLAPSSAQLKPIDLDPPSPSLPPLDLLPPQSSSSPEAEVDPAGISGTAVIALVAVGIAIELIFCVGLYIYYQRWNDRRKRKSLAPMDTKRGLTA